MLPVSLCKTKELIFTNKRDHRAYELVILTDIAVERVQSITYLGTTVDHRLNSEAHSDAVIRKASKLLFTMNKLSS